ncbi:methyltransferase domain-containing protein [Salinisphaera sp. Q1T1-3]|uniref:methyltransferase domain-containing protein n=1 Tax=Salinisphaera sp. Q1T1-3 TaxID=2321229 RepID=UPI00131492F2|nr:methyltransferase domain-containing protein [Salinisphaera sp. Q1T1-3]
MFRELADDKHTARRWHDGPTARLWQRREAVVLADILPRLTGYRCVELGPAATRAARGNGATLRQWHGDLRGGPDVDFVYDGQSLPLASKSVDVLILRHALELTVEPHQLVRECARVLSDRGQIVCLVFNPLSWWALTQVFVRRRHRFCPCGRPPRAARLIDWLRLVEFEATECRRYGSGFPLFSRCWSADRGPRCLAPIAWAAGGYVIVARRRALRRVPPGGKQLLVRKARPGLARAPASGLPCAR